MTVYKDFDTLVNNTDMKLSDNKRTSILVTIILVYSQLRLKLIFSTAAAQQIAQDAPKSSHIPINDFAS